MSDTAWFDIENAPPRHRPPPETIAAAIKLADRRGAFPALTPALALDAWGWALAQDEMLKKIPSEGEKMREALERLMAVVTETRGQSTPLRLAVPPVVDSLLFGRAAKLGLTLPAAWYRPQPRQVVEDARFVAENLLRDPPRELRPRRGAPSARRPGAQRRAAAFVDHLLHNDETSLASIYGEDAARKVAWRLVRALAKISRGDVACVHPRPPPLLDERPRKSGRTRGARAARRTPRKK